MSFKIGDKVIGNENFPYKRVKGVIGTVVHNTDNTRFVRVDFGNKDDIYPCYPNELKLARIRNTKIARKVHPDYEVDGDWLICKSS